MNCPSCDFKATRLGGGTQRVNGGHLEYYQCPECKCKFSIDGSTVKIMSDEPDLPYRSTKQMLKVLRGMMRDDQDWFKEITDDTRTFARQVVRKLK